jgi:Tfp pilus assembly protein PilF
MRKSLLAVTAAVVTMAGSGGPGFAQENADQKSGTVHFETSCNETAQRRFDRAMRYQHSFWYTASREIYEETLKADPEYAIAHWGIALSLTIAPA